MMTTGEKEDNFTNKLDESNLGESPTELVPLRKETTNSKPSKSEYITLHIFKGYYWKIHKPLCLVKISLFFWFAGASTIQTYFPVFLKQRGVSIAQMSLAIVVGIVFQLIFSEISAIVADKIGRIKPVLFTIFSVNVTMCVAFFIIPPLKADFSMQHFYLQDNKNYMLADTLPNCDVNETYNEPSCKLYYNPSHIFDSKQCFNSNIVEQNISQILILNKETIASEKYIEVCPLNSKDIMSYSSFSYKICNGSYCKHLLQECLSRLGECLSQDNKTFLLLLAYAFLTATHLTSFSLTFRCFDDCVISLTSKYNAAFGRQRIFSNIGHLVGPSLAGYVMHFASGNDRDYSLAFVFYGCFTVLSAIASWNFEPPARNPGKRMWRKSVTLLKNPDNLAFVLVLLVLGASFSYMMLFTNWFLEDIGASKILLGLLTPVSSIFTFVILFTSKWWLRKMGAQNIFIMALVIYSFYFVYLSLLFEPWYALLGNIVAFTFSYHLLWVAVVEFSHALAPEGLHATVVISSGVIHYLVSRGLASLLGGTIIDAYGARVAFRVMAGINLVTAILYGCFRYCRRCCQK